MKLTLYDIERLKNKSSLVIPDHRYDGFYWFVDNRNYIIDILYGRLGNPLRCNTIGVNFKKDAMVLQPYLEELLDKACDKFIEEIKPKFARKKYLNVSKLDDHGNYIEKYIDYDDFVAKVKGQP